MKVYVNLEERRCGRIAVEADSLDQASEMVEAMIVDGELEPERVEWNQEEYDTVVVGSEESP